MSPTDWPCLGAAVDGIVGTKTCFLVLVSPESEQERT